MVQMKKFTLGDDWIPKKLGDNEAHLYFYSLHFSVFTIFMNLLNIWVNEGKSAYCTLATGDTWVV